MTDKQEQYRQQCEVALKKAVQHFFQPNSQVSQAAEYSLMNGGKRVRGVLVLAFCELLGGDLRAAADFAAALEMVHAFSLVHDDLPCMDDDNLRRGKPACHIQYGEATALLAGDLLSLEAFETILSAPIEAEWRAKAAIALVSAAGARGMIFGQELDLRYEDEQADGEALRAIQSHKTGALFLATAQLGCLAACQDPALHPAATRYAENIGLVFQIVDDLLDIHATEEALGKPIGSDAEQGKATFVTVFGEEEAARRVAALTEEAVQGLQAAYKERSDFLCSFARTLAGRGY